MIDWNYLCYLIYQDKSIESLEKATEILIEPLDGLEEIIRCLYMKDAYYRLKRKEQMMRYANLELKYFSNTFNNVSLLSKNILARQCDVIIKQLSKHVKGDIIISGCVSNNETIFKISICHDNLLSDELLHNINLITSGKMRDEKYILYRAFANEIEKYFKEEMPRNIYSEIIVNLTRVV